MIICSREKGNELLNEESNLFKGDERNRDIVEYYVSELRRGRQEGTLNLDEEKRKEVATLALTSGLTIEEVSKFTGSSRDSVNAYKHGATSEATYHKRDGELAEHVIEVKEKISGAAQNKLMLAIESLTGEKISSSKARDIAGIAKDMSSVVRNMSPEGGSNININNKVLVYQPRLKEEDDFEVIEVNE